MNTLFLERFKSNHTATLGKLSFGSEFFCFTLEDEFREEKVVGETRIPAGTYRLEKCFESGILNRMKANGWYKKDWIPTICDVPNFQYIRIHTGVNESHTDGCPLVGFGANVKDFTLSNSRAAMLEFVEKLETCFNSSEVFIVITDER